MNGTPEVRSTDLVVDCGAEGVLIYDRRTDAAHSLDGAAGLVWRAIDGRRSLSQIAGDCDLSEAAVAEVLLRLDSMDLLSDAPRERVSRRAALQKVAKMGGAAILAAPLISTVFVPVASAAASACTDPGVLCLEKTFTNGTCTGPGTVAINAPCQGSVGCACIPTRCQNTGLTTSLQVFVCG